MCSSDNTQYQNQKAYQSCSSKSGNKPWSYSFKLIGKEQGGCFWHFRTLGIKCRGALDDDDDDIGDDDDNDHDDESMPELLERREAIKDIGNTRSHHIYIGIEGEENITYRFMPINKMSHWNGIFMQINICVWMWGMISLGLLRHSPNIHLLCNACLDFRSYKWQTKEWVYESLVGGCKLRFITATSRSHIVVSPPAIDT